MPDFPPAPDLSPPPAESETDRMGKLEACPNDHSNAPGQAYCTTCGAKLAAGVEEAGVEEVSPALSDSREPAAPPQKRGRFGALAAIVVIVLLALIATTVYLTIQVGSLKDDRDAALAHGESLQNQVNTARSELENSRSAVNDLTQENAGLMNDISALQDKIDTASATNAACDDLISLMRRALSTASRYPPLVGDALEAGLDQNLVQAKGVANTMSDVNDDLKALADRVGPLQKNCGS